jgi:hypothetical protein
MEKEELEKDIERLKRMLQDYLQIYPILGVGEEEKDRVVNQILDDILYRKKRIEEL